MSNSEAPHLVIASGGTGGHFYPSLAIGRAFKTLCPQGRVTILVAGSHAEAQAKEAEEYGLAVESVSAVRFPNLRKPLDVLLFPFRMVRCYQKAARLLNAIQPDALLAMGSYSAVPSCLAVKKRRYPLLLHEGNAFMGLTNRLFAKKATAIGLGLPLAHPEQAKGRRTEHVGMPLREAILNAAQKKQPCPAGFLESLGLSTAKKTVLVFGGSQGARAVNELFTQSAKTLAPFADAIQFMHLTGTDDNAALLQAYHDAGITASARRADYAIEHCYEAADIIICRAGASSICELALFQKPLVLIPLPSAADNHQMINAQALEAAHAARILPQPTATPELLASLLKDWLDHPDDWTAMGHNLTHFAYPDAAQRMAKLAMEYMTPQDRI